MKAAFAPATPADQQAHYDPYYNHPSTQPHHPHGSSSSQSQSHPHIHHSRPSPPSHHHNHHESSPRHQQHHYSSSSYAHNDQHRHREHEQQHAHHTQEYRPQQQEYPPRPRSPFHPPPSNNYYNGNGGPGSSANNEEQRSYQQHYHSHYPSNSSSQHPPQQPAVVRHTEGYEGRVRNTNRDHNDHLMTSEHHHHNNTHDQQQHHDQYRRDPYGFLKHPSSQYPSSHPSSRTAAAASSHENEEDVNKFHLPPILAPEEPFYRKDLPYRHMRYFRNVTSKDREDKQGYYSSARHVMPSNTTGNFGHGPPIGVALDRFAAKQAQQYQQQQQQQQQHPSQQQQQHAESQSVRLPPLYTALPDQRPSGPSKVSPSYGHSESSPSDQSSPTHSPMQHRPSYGGSPAQSPIEKPMAYGRQHQSHPYHHQSQQQGPMLKPKAIQPRSIAPAPISPTSPAMQQPEVSPRAASKRTDRQTFVKIEPKDMPLQYHQQQQQQHPYQGQAHVQHRLSVSGSQAIAKRKWSREHSPVRQGPRLNTETTAASSESVAPVDRVEDASSAELHLLSSRKQSRSVAVSSSVNKDSTKKSAQKMKMQRYQMTTIRCWHGAIAQKSYGIEKRYLCPPPMVQVSAGVNTKQVRSEQPHVTMSVIHEKVDIRGHHGENLMEQDCTLDDALRCSFRNLHVTGTGSDSSKRFKLGLQVYLNKNATMPTAIMDSNPIPIISKPSKKTAKAGNASCFILNGMSVSLLNRINAQTVRTKYMAVDNNAVCAKIGSWSSFTIKMVKPPPAPPVKLVPASMGVFRSPGHSTKFVPIRMKGENPMGPALAPQAVPMVRANSNGRADGSGVSPNGSAPSSSFQFRHQQQLQHEPVYVFSNSEPVLYGSEIVLINDLTGIMTDRLIIRKVENGKVSRSGTGPVSQMQKIVLEHPDRVHPEDGRSYYLSASSIGSPKIEGKIPLQAAMDRSPLLEYRTSSKKASIMDMTDAQDDDEDEMNEDDDYNGQSNSMPRRMGKNQDSVAVDDFVCWTIAGIAKFDYTYFGPIPASVDSDVDPTKVPSIQSCPQYNANTNTMTMQVKNVFEKLTPTEEARLLKHQEDPYERKLTLSEYVYKRCEDVRQPMRDEEGPIQLWLAQHGPIRMRRRQLEEVLPEGASAPTEMAVDGGDESSDDESSDDEEDGEEKKNNKQQAPEDPLPKIASKSSSSAVSASSNGTSSVAAAAALASAQDAAAAAALAYAAKHQTQLNIMNGRHYGGSHLPASMNPAQKQKRRKLVKKLMGLEAELPYGCEVRASHDAQGHARAELDILMVERSSGIAYRTGYKVVYSRERERADWVVEVLG